MINDRTITVRGIATVKKGDVEVDVIQDFASDNNDLGQNEEPYAQGNDDDVDDQYDDQKNEENDKVFAAGPKKSPKRFRKLRNTAKSYRVFNDTIMRISLLF